MSNVISVINNVTPEDLLIKKYVCSPLLTVQHSRATGNKKITIDDILQERINLNVKDKKSGERFIFSRIIGAGGKFNYTLTSMEDLHYQHDKKLYNVEPYIIFDLDSFKPAVFENMEVTIPDPDSKYVNMHTKFMDVPMLSLFSNQSKLDTEIVKLGTILLVTINDNKMGSIVNEINSDGIKVLIGGFNSPYICYDLDIKFEEFDIIRSVINEK